ncbi:MAG: hypothetical protein HJJLKODD_00959 [Phycisphaerae bacterium]|nr:hypothetical protein [Phycisphaerae bacterium]
MGDWWNQYRRLPLELRLITQLVWWGGLAYGARMALPSQIGNYLLVGVVMVVVVRYAVLKALQWREAGQGRKLDREISGQASGPSRREVAEKEKELRTKWSEGIEKLQRSKVSLYQLPWYMILGEPGGGKTMTLLNSGMDFPLGKDELPGFGGTRNYNWWFTNTAVIMDLAGRLVFEQEGTSDRQEWDAFLKLLKRRRSCPINGVIVALPADKLMGDSAEQRYESAAILRDRLRQIQNTLGVRFPIFFLITKADLIAGFTEFYNELDSVQRNQIFGWSRPGDFDAPYDTKQFGEEFEQLARRLDELRLKFLARKSGAGEMGWIFTYPEAFRSLQQRINDYLEVILSKSIFAEPLFFRGFYFTSALQEGRPVLEVLGKHFSEEELENLEGVFPQSRAFFIHDFYTEKVAREQGMIFRSARHIRQTRVLRHSTLLIGVPVVVAMAVLTWLGYGAYRETVAGPRTTVQKAIVMVQNGSTTGATDDLAAVVKLAQELDAAAEQLREPPALARIMFSSVGQEATRRIRQVQRELIGQRLIVPTVRSVESVLSDSTHVLASEEIQPFGHSMTAYLQAFFGSSSGAWGDLQAVEPAAGSTDAAEWIKRFGDSELGGDWRRAIATDAARGRKTILAAVGRAEQYWQSVANIEQHPDYQWWVQVCARTEEVRTSYGQLLDMEREFQRVGSRQRYEELSQELLKTFPQVDGHSTNTRLLERVRELLSKAPRDSQSGLILSLDVLVENNLKLLDEFCEQLLKAVPGNPSGEGQVELANELRSRLTQLKQQVREQLVSTRGAFKARLAETRFLLEPMPAQAPQRYELVAATEEVERVLQQEVAAGLLPQDEQEVEALLSAWETEVRGLMERTAPTIDLRVEASWEPERLKKLVSTVYQTRRRYEGQALVDRLAQRLEELPEQGLAKFMENEEDESRTRTLRFGGLKNRHAGSFLISTVRAKQSLQQRLAEAEQQGLISDAGYLNEQLNAGVRKYVEHYLRSWSAAYGQQRFEVVAAMVLDPPKNWSEYRQWLGEQGEALGREHEEYQEALLKHALEPFRRADNTGEGEVTARAEIRREAERISWAGAEALEPLFRRYMEGGELKSSAEFIKQWSVWVRQGREFRVERLEDLEQAFDWPVTPAADEKDDRLLVQLQYVLKMGRTLLAREIDEKVLPQLTLVIAAESRPFVISGGNYEGVDDQQLLGLLQELKSWGAFAEHSRLYGDDTQRFAEVGALASQWLMLLEPDALKISVRIAEGNGEINDTAGFGDYYQEVALRLPGMLSEGGETIREIRLSLVSGSAAPVRAWSWRQAKQQQKAGQIVLANPTAKVQMLPNAVPEPRLLALDHDQAEDYTFALFELLERHGQPVDPERRKWHLNIGVEVKELPGLENETADPAFRAVQLVVELATPGVALPLPLDPAQWIDRVPAMPAAPW